MKFTCVQLPLILHQSNIIIFAFMELLPIKPTDQVNSNQTIAYAY